MYWLGHMGITAGAGFISQKILTKTPAKVLKSNPGLWSLDFRAVLAGSLTPDVIDKPLGYLFFDTTRLFGHSITLYLLIFIAGIIMFKNKKGIVAAFSLAAMIHLAEDQMWKQTDVLLWPFLGMKFSPTEQPGIGQRASDFLNENYLLIPEIIGGIALSALILRITANRSWRSFFSTGQIN